MDLRKFQKLCIKELTNGISPVEKEILDKWLSQSPEYKLEYEKIKSVWISSAREEKFSMPDIDAEWNSLYERLELNKIKQASKESLLDKFSFYLQTAFAPKWRPALGGALFIILFALGFVVWNNINSVPQIKTIATGNKEIKEVQLPDGSIVKLNNGSSIQYAESFSGDVREVKLNGEAFFSVVKNSHPFVVETNNAKITVLGTKFDIFARGEKTKVVVKEGKVKFARRENESSSVYLTKGQLSAVTKNLDPNLPEEVDPDYLLGWMNGKLVFNETSLNEIVDELERFYDVPISIEVNNSNTYTLTGSFINHNVDSALTMICLTLNLDFEKQQNGYVIKLKR
jgi:transmembrane sensor